MSACVEGARQHVAASGGARTSRQLTASNRNCFQAEATDAERIVLDLSGLTFIDSTGLRLVLDVNERCGGQVDRLRVIAGSPAVERLLDIVGLRDRLPLIGP